MRLLVWLILAVALAAAAPELAAAQDTGGSIGGGSWDSGGGGGYSSGGGGGDYSSSGGDYDSGGGGSLSDGELWVVLLMFGIWGAVVLAKQLAADHSLHLSAGAGYVAATSDADVTLIRVGLDARVRPFVQAELARIAKVADTKSQAGLVKTLHEVALMLRRLRDAWVYGGAVNHPMSDVHTARRSFQEHVARAREAFRHETVRNADGVVTTGAGATRAPRADEGDGLVMVTLVVAAREELFTVKRIGDGQDLRRALEVLSALTAMTLIAVEIVWTPADPDDRMSSVELEVVFPDVFKIDGAMVGKVVCAYCHGPFPAELISCPHCGAPARDAA